MLNTKRRFLILMVVILGSVLAMSSIFITRFANLGVNTQDPLYFTDYKCSTFTYNNGSVQAPLTFKTQSIHGSYSTVNITFNGQHFLYNTTFDGYYIDPITGATTNQSIFWIHIVEGIGSELVSLIGKTYNIFDPIGILGPANTSYIAIITANRVYWPEEAGLHGAQASLVIEVRDLDGVKVAYGKIDRTCGLLFNLYIGAGNLRTIKLIDTNYEISRNRLTGYLPTILGVIICPIVVFLYLRYFKKDESKEDLIDTTFLVAFGGAVILIDIYIDVWMYAPLGLMGNMLIHSAVLIAGAIFSVLRGYKIKWLIPGVLEILFILSMVYLVGESYVPHMTAFMGLTISWVVLIWLSGHNRQKSKSKLGGLLSNFV